MKTIELTRAQASAMEQIKDGSWKRFSGRRVAMAWRLCEMGLVDYIDCRILGSQMCKIRIGTGVVDSQAATDFFKTP